ncbi:MAG: N-glycosylase/DNA lyase [Candidatus Pacearchaeota archaeon]
MKDLLDKVRQLEKSDINNIVESRLAEFNSFKTKSEDEWFSELCFCILTANAKQATSAIIQAQLSADGFKTLSQETLTNLIKVNKHRFHNNKAKYIVQAREFANVKSIIQDMSEIQAREWLVEHINGIGMKEASHFIRNTGGQSLAILDRHILATMTENGIIKRPKSLTAQSYLEIEKAFTQLASTLRMSPAKLDLMIWYLRNGEIAK